MVGRQLEAIVLQRVVDIVLRREGVHRISYGRETGYVMKGAVGYVMEGNWRISFYRGTGGYYVTEWGEGERDLEDIILWRGQGGKNGFHVIGGKHCYLGAEVYHVTGDLTIC